ncbi:MAG TPA: C-GCAxxG-C-C family protein [Anaerolineales bacterium]|nr:C-GCAxxG-C-C family protein [Anaerolineales bacterium]
MDSQKISPKYNAAAGRKYYPLAFSNLLHMGHCAPTVMQSIQDITSNQKEWLVRLSAGMPGGIGNTGNECGGVTSPLVLLGTQFGLRERDGGLPEIVHRGHALCQNFAACHHTLQCKAIRGNDHFPRHCIPPVLRSPGMFMDAQNGHHVDPIPPQARASYTKLYAHLKENQFHCARAVFTRLGYDLEKDKELFNAASAFMGGTLFMGRTCSAFTAGVMAIGLRIGEIEDSPLRVIRLLAIMTVDGNAFDDKLNKFNHSMNLGYKLSKWFTREFGSTQCQAITQCDFADPAGVDNFIGSGGINHCKQITEKVADKISLMLA